MTNVDKTSMCPHHVCLQVLYYNHFSYNHRRGPPRITAKLDLVYTRLTITRITRLQKSGLKFAFNEYKHIYDLHHNAHPL